MFLRSTPLSVSVLALHLFTAIPAVAKGYDDLFCGTGPVFADHGIELSGGSAISPATPDLGLEIRSNADVVIGGHSWVEGDAHASRRVIVHGNGELVGAGLEGAAPAPLPDLDALVSTHRHQNDNHHIPLSHLGRVAVEGSVLMLSAGDALTVPEGDYFFTRITVSGGVLYLSGSVRFYVDGPVHLSGHTLANAGDAEADFVILGASERSSLTLSGHAEHAGSAVLPRGDVTLTGRSQMWGGVLARSLEVSGGSRLLSQDVCRQGPPELDEACLEWSEGECVQGGR